MLLLSCSITHRLFWEGKLVRKLFCLSQKENTHTVGSTVLRCRSLMPCSGQIYYQDVQPQGNNNSIFLQVEWKTHYPFEWKYFSVDNLHSDMWQIQTGNINYNELDVFFFSCVCVYLRITFAFRCFRCLWMLMQRFEKQTSTLVGEVRHEAMFTFTG